MTTHDRLVAARKLIEDPEHWTIGTSMRNQMGRTTYEKESAYSYCSMGAVKCAGEHEDPITREFNPEYCDAMEILRHAAIKMGYIGIVDLNDNPFVEPNKHHPLVLKMFDIAIELAKDI